jgi:hypothetical protein
MATSTENSDIAVWARVIHNGGAMPPEVASYLLTLEFERRDLDRMHTLAVKNQAGDLSEDERKELEGFRRLAAQFDILRSKARMALHDRGTA